jgi:hypothetical protein
MRFKTIAGNQNHQTMEVKGKQRKRILKVYLIIWRRREVNSFWLFRALHQKLFWLIRIDVVVIRRRKRLTTRM